uniref:Putative VSG lipase n=1 Tax=Trypanosoma congolense (strain IL3000) TaxID=1068625 RepID=G0UJN3_TRYCI|nr:putative VSG lipase [Trypanosoma congolense IL3000]
MPETEGIKWSPQSWMDNLRSSIEGRAITQLFMVGAHNTGTDAIHMFSPFGLDAPEAIYGMNEGVAFLLRFLTAGVSSRWARCQSMSARQLLNHGVRYLDLRLTAGANGIDRIYTTHFHASLPLKEIIVDVKNFLETPTCGNEFIILDFQHFYGFTDESMGKFVEELSPLSDYLIPSNVPLTTPLSTLWRSSTTQRVFLVVKPTIHHPAARLRGWALRSIWLDELQLEALLERLNRLLTRELVDAPDERVPSKLYVTQAIGTPKNKDVAMGACCGACPSANPDLEDVAKKINSPLLSWFYTLNAEGTVADRPVNLKKGNNTHGNILLLDFIQHGTCPVGKNKDLVNAVGMCVYLNTQDTARI